MIEELTFHVTPDRLDDFLEHDHSIWTDTLAKQSGFLGKRVWTSTKRENNVRLIVMWESLAAWQAVPKSLLKQTEAEFAAAMGGTDDFKLISVNAWQQKNLNSAKRSVSSAVQLSETVRQLSSEATNITVDRDLSYGKRKRYRAVPLAKVIRKAFDIDANDPAKTRVIFHCRDDYQATMSLENALQAEAWLAFHDLEAPDNSSWIDITKASTKKSPAPFYVVWTKKLGQYKDFPWPYAIKSLELRPAAPEQKEQEPKEIVTEPFEGVTVRTIQLAHPRPLRICVAEVDLTNDGVSFLVSPGNGDPNGDEPGDPNNETTRQTTLDFLREHNAQLAINATFFGMGTTDTDNIGLVASRGNLISPFRKDWPAINIDADNRVAVLLGEQDSFRVTGPDSDVSIHNAISGSDHIVTDGKPTTDQREFSTTAHPRTAIGYTTNRKLHLVTVDGRQPGISEGMSLVELANFMLSLGCTQAINLDGGGSTTMAIADPKPRVLNTPSSKSENGEYGVPRKNGTNLAVFARPKSPE